MSAVPDLEVGQYSTAHPAPRNRTSDPAPEQEPEEPRMIGDFDGSANEFWQLYIDEARSHDDIRINSLKSGMDSAGIFAGLFSAVLTAFVVDRKQDLKPSPAEEAVYYLRQHSMILSQISVQLSTIAPQVSIPSTPPPPFPVFNPSPSDVRVNAFWFMALVFSLLAALLAMLVQRWVRKYMLVFQRYSDPLKSARLRQYLYEGCEGWNMPKVAHAVPGFLQVSLFLFFAGLGDTLLNINTNVALGTTVLIGVSGLLYIYAMFLPIVFPQSPYENLFSGILWYVIQKSYGRRFRDRGFDGETKSVSGNFAQGQMQLAMEETEARKGRDAQAIRWLFDNLTEDAEMEKLLSAIPGSFNTNWGAEVWKRVGTHQGREYQSQDEPVARPHGDTATDQPSSSWSIRSVLRPIIHLVRKPTPHHPTFATTHSPVPHLPNVHRHPTTAHIRRENVVYGLSTRVARSLVTYKNLENNVLWRKRTRVYIEVTASLVCCANADLSWFGGISKLLGDIGGSENIRESSLAGTDEFMMRWTCLSLVAIQRILADSRNVQDSATQAMKWFARADHTGNNDAVAAAQKIDETLKKASDCLFRLHDALRETEDQTEEVKEILLRHESEISELEQINIEADRLEWVDIGIFNIQSAIKDESHQIFSQFPGVLDDSGAYYGAPILFSRLVNLSGNPRKLQFIRPGQTLKSIRPPALTLHNILEGQEDAAAYKELLNYLEYLRFPSGWVQRQLWRMQDLRYGGGLGFTVELFFLAFSQLLSTSPSKESHSALYTGTFRAITSDWSKYKDCPGTQKLLLHIATSRRWEFDEDYPAYIAKEFLLLLGNIFEGQTGSHIDEVRQEFEPRRAFGPRKFRERVLRALPEGQAG